MGNIAQRHSDLSLGLQALPCIPEHLFLIIEDWTGVKLRDGLALLLLIKQALQLGTYFQVPSDALLQFPV